MANRLFTVSMVALEQQLFFGEVIIYCIEFCSY